MRPKIGGFVAVAIGIAIVFGIFVSQDDGKNDQLETRIFHVTLASPEIYENGRFTDTFQAQEGNFEFSFVPNGDSPKILTIFLNGDSFNFEENFELVGTSHETGVSTYFTWDYSGMKEFQIKNEQELEIVIDPNGELLGPVSVDITQK